MGTVYRGRNTQLNRELAVKVLLDEHCSRPDLVQRFWEEAQIAAQLQHPGVAPVYEVGRFADERPYFTMKLVQGHTLSALLSQRRDPQAELGRFLAVFAQVCQTVAYAHSQGVIHRDLKPQNVMVGAFGEVQVMDWGLAKVMWAAPEPSSAAGPPVGGAPLPSGEAGSTAPHSRTGVVGTPAYMPPEQARGDEVDERADVFSLGAMLTEILTGRPPYVGANRIEAFQAAQRGELEGARQRLDESRTNGDLVVLAKRCLAVEPCNRPRDAAEVAQAVIDHLASVEQRARQAEQARAAAQARAVEVRKRLRVTLGLAAAVVALILVAATSGLIVQRQAITHREAVLRRDWQERSTIEFGFDRTASLVRESRWAESRAALDQIASQLTAASPEDLHQRLTEARSELALVDRLDAIRFRGLQHLQGVSAHGGLQFAEIDAEYEAAFSEAGLARVGEDPAAVAERIKVSTIAAPLLAALDAWASKTEDDERRAWLLSVARLVDPHPERDRFRDAALWADSQALTQELAGSQKLALTPTLATALAFRIWGTAPNREAADVAFRVLGTTHREHPDDFWPAFSLGFLLDRANRRDRASGYYRAAVAIRPDAERAWAALGASLLEEATKGISAEQMEEVIGCYRAAIRLDPQRAETHGMLGLALGMYGDLDAAAWHLQQSVDLDPNPASPAREKLAMVYANQGAKALASGRFEDGIAYYRKSAQLLPTSPQALEGLAGALHAGGELEEALTTLLQAIAIEPANHDRRRLLGNWLMSTDRMEEAIDVFQKLVDERPTDIRYRAWLSTGLANVGRFDEAVQHAQKGVELDPAEADMQGTYGMALTAVGRFAEARLALRRALDSPNAKDQEKREQWNALLKVCDRMVVVDQRLTDYLHGKYSPHSTGERIELANLCLRTRRHYMAVVQLYEEAFATDPSLADPRLAHRYHAAKAAVFAALGKGNDAPSSDETEQRAQLRRKAHEWLVADSTWLLGAPDPGEAKFRASLLQMLQSWQAEPELAASREVDQLQNLPAPERDEWNAFWKDVRAVAQQLESDR
jgi:serine/threonine-protein kinase